MPKSSVSQALNEVDDTIAEEDVSTATENIFDVSKYKISATPESRTLTIDGASFDVKVKPLSWSLRNQILSKSLK